MPTALESLQKELQASGTLLVAVSKTHPPEAVLELYEQGHRDFGENRVQELISKWEALPKDIRWHLIGHLQTNKVKYIAPFVHMIHSVDSLKLLREIDKQAEKAGRIIPCLLQIHIAREETKFGLDRDELFELLDALQQAPLPHASVQGLMGMATFTENETLIRSEFRELKGLFEEVRQKYFEGQPAFRELSMGMSGDYGIAIEEGSTMIRVGSLLFGPRTP
jgi:pyridoxal phosphate enzyme (YggS family)